MQKNETKNCECKNCSNVDEKNPAHASNCDKKGCDNRQ